MKKYSYREKKIEKENWWENEKWLENERVKKQH